MNAQPIIELRRVSKLYHKGDADIHPLDDLSLTIDQGDFVALMGPSGSGKTTLLNLLGGLDTPTSGEVIVCGQDLTELSSRTRPLAQRPRGLHLSSLQSAARVDRLPERRIAADALPLSRRERREHVLAALEIVGLADRMSHRPDELSGGQEQRVAIARALASDPEILLADEPTGDLDAHSAEEIMALLIALNRDFGKTIIVVTHDPKVAHVAHRQLHLEKGVLTRDVDTRKERT